MNKIFFLRLVFCVLMAACATTSFAQDEKQDLMQARVHVEKKELPKAQEIYKRLYSRNPIDLEIYNEYLQLLLNIKDLKTAEKLVGEQQRIRLNNPLPFVDRGRIYLADGKEKKATEQFDEALKLINGDDILTQQVANAFTVIQREDYTLKTYERAKELLRNPYMYSGPLSRLYAKRGDVDKAVYTMLEATPGQMGGLDDTKAILLELLEADAKKIQVAQKAIVKKINEQPENPYYAELLTWLYTQKDDWEGALIQIEALDERNKENGERLEEFAQLALKEKQYEYAIKAYDAILVKGKDKPFYSNARNEKLLVSLQTLQDKPARTKEEVTKLETEYEAFFTEFPQFYATQTVRDYAKLVGEYGNNPAKAIGILEKALSTPNIRRDLAGMIKLQTGDYHILMGTVWEASLLYSQVDKDFREDILGEEARFRNAKLSYYRGDFVWAQGQLSVLKASTSELISNDALYLSVLITENIPPDSNLVPLRRFAYADLLLFQNKDVEAETLLDSITNAFPEHPLKDDILMQRARIAQKQLNYAKALEYLKQVYEKHGDDVLGDDAIYHAAEITEKYLKKNDEAKLLYEKLVITYPGSTFVQAARNRLNELQTPAVP